MSSETLWRMMQTKDFLTRNDACHARLRKRWTATLSGSDLKAAERVLSPRPTLLASSRLLACGSVMLHGTGIAARSRRLTVSR